MSKDKEPHDLVCYQSEDGVWTWECADCGQTVHRMVNGQALFWANKAQAEHVCPNDAAEKRLPVDRIRLREVLNELGVRIEIYDGIEVGSAELMLVDKETGVELRLGEETLG